MPRAGRPPVIDDKTFIELVEKYTTPEVARKLGVTKRAVQARRVYLEKVLKRPIYGQVDDSHSRFRPAAYPHRFCLNIRNGVVIAFGDAHYWPGKPSLMHKAVVSIAKNYGKHLKAIVANGDIIDACTISRWGPHRWEGRPSLADEIDTAKERCAEIENAVPGATTVWNLGNHDQRFETRLATVAPEYAKIHGVHLKDHFPAWEPAWATWINDQVVIKHRFKGGIYHARQDTLFSGKTIVTGDKHSAQVWIFTDYNGTRYGVDTGCIADTNCKAFVDYTEDNPTGWTSGFCVLTFVDGKVLQPDLVLKWDEKRIQFQGEIFAP